MSTVGSVGAAVVAGAAAVVGAAAASVAGVVDAAAGVVGAAAAAVVPAAAVVLALLESLPQAVATSESEKNPARTSRRVIEFTYVSPWLGMNNVVTVKIEVEARVVRR